MCEDHSHYKFSEVRHIIDAIFYSFFTGAVFSLIILIRNRNLSARLMYVLNYVKTALVTKSIPYYDYKSDGKQNVIPFSAVIFAGFLIYYMH